MIAANRDFGAAQCIQRLRESPRAFELRERSGGPVLRIEWHRHAKCLATAIDDGEALEQIVDMVFANTQPQHAIFNRAGSFKVADTTAIEHHACQREFVLLDRARHRARAAGTRRK